MCSPTYQIMERKKNMEAKNLGEKHATAWAILQSLPDGERILGEDLMKRLNIEDKRVFYSIIEDLRKNLFFVVGSKSKGGYWIARHQRDIDHLLHTLRKPAMSSLSLAQKIENEWHRRKPAQ